MFAKLVNLLQCVFSLILRIIDWRKAAKRDRALDEANRAIAEHDREAVNRIIAERTRHD